MFRRHSLPATSTSDSRQLYGEKFGWCFKASSNLQKLTETLGSSWELFGSLRVIFENLWMTSGQIIKKQLGETPHSNWDQGSSRLLWEAGHVHVTSLVQNSPQTRLYETLYKHLANRNCLCIGILFKSAKPLSLFRITPQLLTRASKKDCYFF